MCGVWMRHREIEGGVSSEPNVSDEVEQCGV